jgi:predicted lipid-binding transport protein (Tim44 family)
MFPSRLRLALVLGAFAAVLTMIAADVADARGRISIGSRGSRTQSAPPATTTAPTARPIERSTTQPTNPTAKAAPRATPAVVVVPMPPAAPAANANRPGFTGGLLGAGLFGLLLGAGLTGGLGGTASFLGLALQIGIIAAVGWALLGLLQRRDQVPVRDLQPQRPPRNRSDFGLRNAAPR